MAAILGLRVLMATAAALSVGVGAGFQNAFDDAWEVSHLPTAAPPAPRAFAEHRVIVTPHVGEKHVIAVSRPRAVILVTQKPAIATTSPRPKAHSIAVHELHRAAARHESRRREAIIAARTDDEPVYEVTPAAPGVATAAPNAAPVRISQPTATPSASPSPAPNEKSWLHRQLGHFNPFKPYKTAPEPTSSPPR